MKLKHFMVMLLALILTACATTGENPKDPYEDYNRSVWEFNKGLDTYVLRPVAEGYQAVTPDPVEKGVSNFFSNLGEITTIANDILQWKIGKAGKDTLRFLINSTLGLAGLFDPASEMGLEKEEEDFGQTLAVWGVESGAYWMLPFFGPSTTRDGFGTIVDAAYYNPFGFLNEDQEVKLGLYGLQVIDKRASLLALDDVLKEAIDDYALVRDAYLQQRDFKIHDGSPPIEDDECEFEEDCEDF